MKGPTLGKLVSNKSICCSTHRTRLESMGHPFEYIVLPRAHKTFACSFVNLICFTTFSAHVLHTCHKHKNIFSLDQMLLHEKKYQ